MLPKLKLGTMTMLWCLLLLQGLASAFFTRAGEEDITITKCNLGPVPTEFELCWADSGINAYDGATLTVLKGGSPVVINLIPTVVNAPCASFTHDLGLAAGDNVDFLLNLLVSGLRMGIGKIHFQVPVTVQCDSVDKLGNEGQYLRFSCTRGFTSNDVISINETQTLNCIFVSKGTISYCFNSNQEVTATSLTLCENVNAIHNDDTFGTVLVCSAFGPVKGPPQDVIGITIAELNYFGPAHTLTICPLSSQSNKFEVVNVWDGGDPYYMSPICTGTTLNPYNIDCKVALYTPGTGLMNFIVVGYSSQTPNLMLESIEHNIHDYDLKADFIFSSTLEMIWTPEAGVLNYWTSMICSPATSIIYEASMVTCTSDTAPCYSYVLDEGVSPAVCRPALQPDYGNGADSTRKIVTTVDKVSKDTRKELHITEVDIYWERDNFETPATVSLCFKHTSYDAETVSSRYEIMMINRSGQWLKHTQITSDTDDDLCFSPLVVDTESFDVTDAVTVAVIQRAEDGTSILASGETSFNFYGHH